ncbi:MAG TPA: large conductance mechanosensitive channel protein MscL [Edaphocola sp.]|nr:large conductance mechanosensitive channel protein MscL [Edaphocola sp.]
MGFVKEFKEFALKGNVMDMAVGIIIGAAFSSIVSSLVEDVITPLILTPVLQKMGVDRIQDLVYNGVAYGKFLSAVLAFIMIALVIFMMIKAMNKLRKPAQVEAPAGPTATEQLLAEIRDELKKK